MIQDLSLSHPSHEDLRRQRKSRDRKAVPSFKDMYAIGVARKGTDKMTVWTFVLATDRERRPPTKCPKLVQFVVYFVRPWFRRRQTGSQAAQTRSVRLCRVVMSAEYYLSGTNHEEV